MPQQSPAPTKTFLNTIGDLVLDSDMRGLHKLLLPAVAEMVAVRVLDEMLEEMLEEYPKAETWSLSYGGSSLEDVPESIRRSRSLGWINAFGNAEFIRWGCIRFEADPDDSITEEGAFDLWVALAFDETQALKIACLAHCAAS